MLRPLIVSITSFVFLLACGQSDGAPCQTSSDCQSGLVCCKASARLEERGVCRPPDVICLPTTGDAGRDATTDTSDSGPTDAATDSAAPTDAASDPDAQAVDSSADVTTDVASEVGADTEPDTN